jgi:hypothetical protein
MRWTRLLEWLADRFPRRDICGSDGSLYLSRYRLFGWSPGTPGRYPFSVYLHHFHRPDEDDAPHNHPWAWAVSLILAGGYVERRGGPLRLVLPGMINVIKPDTFHVVEHLLGECWTLIVVGPKAQSWGFEVSGQGYVPWRDRLRQRGIQPDY